MQRLSREGIDVEEFPEYDRQPDRRQPNPSRRIRGRNIVVYPAADIRLDSRDRDPRDQPKKAEDLARTGMHKIDVVVALAMAALACVRAQSVLSYDVSMRWAV